MDEPVCARNDHASRLAAFTLVEIVIALALFAFAIAGILGVMTSAMDSNRQAQEFSVVTDLNGSLLADLQARAYSDPLPADTYLYDADGNEVSSEAAAHFRCRLVAVAVPAGVQARLPASSPPDALRGIRLEWEWPVNAASRRTLTSHLLLANPAPFATP